MPATSAATKPAPARAAHEFTVEDVEYLAPGGSPLLLRLFKPKGAGPFPLMIDGFAKLAAGALFVMPERVAKTDASTQISEVIGSGPFKFSKDEWQPGNRVVYVRNAFVAVCGSGM